MISWTTQISDSAFTRLNQTFGSNGVLVHITCQSEAKKWFELLEASCTMFHWFLDQMRSHQSMYTPRHIYFLLCLKWACGATRKRLAGATKANQWHRARQLAELPSIWQVNRTCASSCLEVQLNGIAASQEKNRLFAGAERHTHLHIHIDGEKLPSWYQIIFADAAWRDLLARFVRNHHEVWCSACKGFWRLRWVIIQQFFVETLWKMSCHDSNV